MIWKSLILVTGSESPVSIVHAHAVVQPHIVQAVETLCQQVVVVLSGSMEPGFYRGDILFLHLGKRPIRTGTCINIVIFHCQEL
jgi:signal peptidase